MAATVAMPAAGDYTDFSAKNLTGSSATVEQLIRTAVETNRIRLVDSFRDFDPLRSGFVTTTQFFRTLSQTLRMNFTDDQMTYLTGRYGSARKDGRIDYTAFCNVIDERFDPNLMSVDPSLQKTKSVKFLGTEQTVSALTDEENEKLEQLLYKMIHYYKYHGINLRTCYEDFDLHHKGVITESQFYRNFPGPPNVSIEEMRLLIQRYNDPTRAGLINYLNLNLALETLKDGAEKSLAELYKKPDLTEYLTKLPADDPTLQEIFDKIRVAVFKSGVRTTEYFKDHDKLRHGVITDNQFVCGLSLAIGKEAALSRSEVQKVVEHYRTVDGRVRYKEFCDMMENAFNVPDLEKKPTQEMSRPPRGALARPFISSELSDKETTRAEELLREISDRVRKRRLMMYQYFKDYDRGRGYTRIVTKSQFSRILHFLSLNVNEEDFKLLCKMFSDVTSGDINYPAFVQAVDTEFVGFKLEALLDRTEETSAATDDKSSQELVSTQEDVNLDVLMTRIRGLVLKNRYRVSEYFYDFDPLNSGSISTTQFRRGLASMGLSKLGKHDLTQAQFDKLSQYYINKVKPDQVLWKDFLKDIESVFTQPNLEKTPTCRVPPQEVFLVPNPGTVDWSLASDDDKELVDRTLARLRQRVQQRRLHVKPPFQDFDAHNQQYVTRNQFRQCLTILELHCSEAEMVALGAKYCDDNGFNYARFLQDLEPAEAPTLMYENRLTELRKINQQKKLPEIDPCRDLEGVLTKIKIKVYRQPVRTLDFMSDYDKLNHGRVNKTSFRRALKLARFELTESEMDILEDAFQHHFYPDFVDYRQFCDEIESIFTTKDLEKNPLLEVNQFQPPNEMEINELTPEAEELLRGCCGKLAERVRVGRMQLFPLFEDYDRVHIGTVSRSQFRRTLSELGLGSMLSDQEFQVLYQKFDIKVGGRDDVNYIAFCHLVYDMANFDWQKP